MFPTCRLFGTPLKVETGQSLQGKTLALLTVTETAPKGDWNLAETSTPHVTREIQAILFNAGTGFIQETERHRATQSDAERHGERHEPRVEEPLGFRTIIQGINGHNYISNCWQRH